MVMKLFKYPVMAVIVTLVYIALSFVIVNAETNSNSTNSSENHNSMAIIMGGDSGETTSNIRSAPNVPFIMHNELPSYFGPHEEQMWNTQEDTLLPFILMTVPEFEVEYGFMYQNLVKSHIDIFSPNKYKGLKFVKVLNGIEKLRGISYHFVGVTTVHGNRKDTSVLCLKQAIIDTGEAGGNVFLLMKVSSDTGITSTTWGIGGSGAGNFGMTGKDAYSAGSAMGISSNKGGPIRKPYLHGLILKVSDTVYARIKPDGLFNTIKNPAEQSTSKTVLIDTKIKGDNVK